MSEIITRPPRIGKPDFTDLPMPNIEQAILHRIRMGCGAIFTAEMMEQMEIEVVSIGDRMTVQLRAFCTAIGEDRITIHRSWPRTWWDAVKDRWAPKWWWWPAQYDHVDIDRKVYQAVCPHHAPLTQSHEMHINWLLEQRA